MLDAVIDYLPSPVDVPPLQGMDVDREEMIELPPRDDAPLSALVLRLSPIPMWDVWLTSVCTLVFLLRVKC